MALRALMLRKKLTTKQKELEALRAKSETLQTREAELEQAIAEVTTDEEQKAVEEEVETFETERKENDDAIAVLETEVAGLENELAETEAEQERTVPTPEETAEREAAPEPIKEERSITLMRKNAIIEKMTPAERTALVGDEKVQAWLGQVRTSIREKRSLSGVGLTIPEVILPLLRENITNWSKLYDKVTLRRINGIGRQVIMGTIPEAIWIECCQTLNELSLSFADWEVDCYKVGGYFVVCNANIDDSDLDLLAELMEALGQAIGKALDKAILYGTGTRMPLGIATRLAQTSQPESYPATARAWVDLHTSNIKTIANSVTGVALFQSIVINMGNAKGKYARGPIVHVMNEKTYSFIKAQAMSIDAGGAIVSAVNGVMPVIGGVIEVLEDVPDYNIISGYFDLYLLGERAGQKFASSEHFRFLSDQTVFKGTARYDGAPAIAEGFVINAINGESATTSLTFAADDANAVKAIRMNTATATVASGSTVQLYAYTEPGMGAVTWESATTGKATVSTNGLVTGVASGSSVITAKCNGLSASCTVTVTT